MRKILIMCSKGTYCLVLILCMSAILLTLPETPQAQLADSA